MSLEDKEKLTKQMNEKALKDFSLEEIVLYTLDNFNYRYLESDSTGPVKAEKLGENAFASKAVETNLNSFQDSEHLKDFLKDKPASVLIGVFLEFAPQSKGFKLNAQSFVNKAHPEFDMSPQNLKQIIKTFVYEDALDLRNKLAKDFEEVFELF